MLADCRGIDQDQLYETLAKAVCTKREELALVDRVKDRKLLLREVQAAKKGAVKYLRQLDAICHRILRKITSDAMTGGTDWPYKLDMETHAKIVELFHLLQNTEPIQVGRHNFSKGGKRRRDFWNPSAEVGLKGLDVPRDTRRALYKALGLTTPKRPSRD